ncbi:permease [Urbifossiella limnaea]|uniref:Putative permease n=1 Tax=Urbifossiella limnaea TaxID=2528023 RepID=A0A517XUG1_9BACT|nr:permease [Urbifossiella limnaea]QDU21124.1 putative permease [Urbifossiella limnaea]
MKDILDFILTFSSILWEAMPFIILGAVVAGILEEFLPQQAITKYLPKSVVPAVMIGAVIGLVFPMCECGILVVMRRLLRKGLPLSCCVAYMLAGPIINPVVMFSTGVAFWPHKIGPEVLGLRVGLGFVVAVVTGLVVQGLWVKHGRALLNPVALPPESKLSLPVTDAPAPRKPLSKRLGNISATAVHDFVDITVFLILGAVLAAVAKLYITQDQIQYLSREQPFLAIPAMMGLAVLMCLCSEADAFVAASFTNMHISAKTAFLVLGPMLDLKLLLMYTRVFRPRLIGVIVTCVVLQVLAYCYAVHLVYQMNGWTGLPPSS